MMGKRSLWRGAEEGATAVEAAVTMSALLFMLLGSIQFALVFWNWNTMLLAVEEAGRYAMLFHNYPNGPPSPHCTVASPTLATCAVDWANSQNWGNLFTVTCSSGCAVNSTTMTFTATYTFNFITSISLSRGIQVPVI